MLFPLEQGEKLVGIARLAQQSRLLRAKSEVEYFELPTRGILNRCSNPRMPFTWTINPYRGCEFGCKYCYARYTHEFMGMDDGRLFEQKIYAKQDAGRTLRAELRRHPEGSIAIGTSTDPYQPAERRFEVTRAILEVFAAERGRSLSITTKSDLIVRDVELLDLIRRRNVLHINMTVTTTDTELARKLEPRAPRPDLRLEAVRQLARRGLSVGVFANPVMPMLTDTLENLSALAAAAEEAGARYFGGGTLFLMPSALAQFLPFLEREFPALARRYRARYGRQPYLRGEYAKVVRERVEQVRANHHLAASPQPYQPEEWSPDPQQKLFG
jgi:DNA repair photolyase